MSEALYQAGGPEFNIRASPNRNGFSNGALCVGKRARYGESHTHKHTHTRALKTSISND